MACDTRKLGRPGEQAPGVVASAVLVRQPAIDGNQEGDGCSGRIPQSVQHPLHGRSNLTHQPPCLVLPAGFEQAHGQQTSRLQADEEGTSTLADRSHASASTGMASSRRSSPDSTAPSVIRVTTYPCRVGSVSRRRRPLGISQHQWWIGPHHRVERRPEHGSAAATLRHPW